MAFVPANNCIQAELIYELHGQVVENVLHYVPDVPVTDANMVELADGLITRWPVYLQSWLSDDLTLNIVRVTDLTTQFSNGFDITTGLPLTGGKTGSIESSLPNNVAVAVTKNTLFRGRSRRGRIFQMGITEDEVIGNTISEALRSALVTAYTNMSLIIENGINFQMVVLSRWENNVQRQQALLTPVEFVTVDTTVDSQRRRLPGRGN